MVPEIWRMKNNFLSFWTFFSPFTLPPKNLKNQNYEKMKKKKKPGDIILYMCNINDNHMMYSSWDMKRDRHNFLSFWTIFCLFTLLKTRKIKILKKKKKTPEDIIILQKYTKNYDHMLYCSWDMAHDGCNCYFHFGLFFALLPS